MDTNLAITEKIVNYQGQDKLEILISVKSALIDLFECPWIIINNEIGLDQQIKRFESIPFYDFRILNEKNLKKLNLNFLDIHLLPKNKKNKLSSLVDNLIFNLNDQSEIIYDFVRINPFLSDTLFDFILNNQDNINQNLFSIYKNRNESSEFLKEKHFSKNYFNNCFDIAKRQKIIYMWKTTWHKIELYNNKNSFVENLLL